jgi:hypothetical protein
VTKLGIVRFLSVSLLGGFGSVGALQAQAPLSSGTYFIHSDYLNDNRCVDLRTQDNETIQLYFCNGAKDEKFEVSQTSTGTYTIAAVSGASNSCLSMQVQNGVQAVHSFVNCNVTWKIQKAAGSPAGSNSTNIFVASGLFEQGPATPVSLTGLIWNRKDPDSDGRIQLMRPPPGGQSDPHNNFSFQLTQ